MTHDMSVASPSPLYSGFKRLVDVVLATLTLVLGLPVLLLIAVLIVAESGRPVFFRQKRIGRGGVPFMIVKFRSLRLGRHDSALPGRLVTRVGRVLRRWGLDELPQLWNILRGEMSLVGPRPMLPAQVAAFDAYERRRLAVRPGITGWAQIHGRNALPWPERIRLDVWYIEHCSPWLDAYILLKTPFFLMAGKGVYGAGGKNPDFPRRTEHAPLGTDDSP